MQTYSLQNITNSTPFRDFHTPNGVAYKNFEEHKNNTAKPNKDLEHQDNKAKKILPLIGTIIGTMLPIIVLNKACGKHLDKNILKNGKTLDKLKEIGEYFEIDSVKKILSTAAGAIAGGIAGGCIADKDKENRKEKLKEGMFEMTNITVPTIFVAGISKLLENKNLPIPTVVKKIAPVVTGLGIGIPIASKISGMMSQKIFKEDKNNVRKFKPKDLIVHSDDMIAVLALSKINILQKLQIDKILALIYAKCGYEAGTADKNAKGHGHHHH